MTMIAPEQARENLENAVSDVQRGVLAMLAGQDELPLRTVLNSLVHEGRTPLELVSRALARLLTTDQVQLTPERRLRITKLSAG